MGALVDYLDLTQRGRLPLLRPPVREAVGGFLQIDAATQRNLELVRTLGGERKGSLLSCIDRTITGAGARLLQSRLTAPLATRNAIERRLDEVAVFTADARLRDAVREHLHNIPDMERALARITSERAGPKDIGAIRYGLKWSEKIRSVLLSAGEKAKSLSPLADDLCQSAETQALADTLGRALKDDLPFLARDGGFIAKDYHPKLDDLRLLRDESRRLIAALQSRYQGETGINALKISFNNVLGYFIEVPSKSADKLIVRRGEENASDNPFIHRQTMANNVRFTTPELSELERDISQAADRALAIERQIFDEFVTVIAKLSEDIGRHARALAALDVASSLALLASEENYARPEIEDSVAFEIHKGRHPVVEQALRRESGGAFMSNDCSLGDGNRLWLLTGPNMAGKSTFLRQNALLAILAQTGCFVPAASAKIGIVDRVFSRVGASDDLASGRSTFMVEMVETASILNLATERSLVILDEIGRGTATFDGLSIAWACVEHLHEKNRCRALFATHYHELTSLETRLGNLSCHSLQVKEWKDEIVFLHFVKPGSADRSYGIHVAKLAGLPDIVIRRSEQILQSLQQGEKSGALEKLSEDLPLFSALAEKVEREKPSMAPASPALEKLAAVNPDDLTPREALQILYDLKAALDG
jgi:DNA mismatch repair protein MutS